MKRKRHYMAYDEWLRGKYLSRTHCGLRVGGYLMPNLSYTFYKDEVTCPKCREALEKEQETI